MLELGLLEAAGVAIPSRAHASRRRATATRILPRYARLAFSDANAFLFFLAAMVFIFVGGRIVEGPFGVSPMSYHPVRSDKSILLHVIGEFSFLTGAHQSAAENGCGNWSGKKYLASPGISRMRASPVQDDGMHLAQGRSVRKQWFGHAGALLEHCPLRAYYKQRKWAILPR
jgi:hypothetical protein